MKGSTKEEKLKQIEEEGAAKTRTMRFWVASLLALQATLKSHKAFGADVYIRPNADEEDFNYEGPTIEIKFNGGVWDFSGEDYTFVWECEIPVEFLEQPMIGFNAHLRVTGKDIDLTGQASYNGVTSFGFKAAD